MSTFVLLSFILWNTNLKIYIVFKILSVISALSFSLQFNNFKVMVVGNMRVISLKLYAHPSTFIVVSHVHTLKQNGIAEHKYCHIVDIAHILLVTSYVPLSH